MKQSILLIGVCAVAVVAVQVGCKRQNEFSSLESRAASIIPMITEGKLFWSASTRKSDHTRYTLLYNVPRPIETFLANTEASKLPGNLKIYEDGSRSYKAAHESSELQGISVQSGEWYHRAEPIAPYVRKKADNTAVRFSFRINH